MTKIYAIINGFNLKMYIGQTSGSLSRRWNAHMSTSKRGTTPIYRAIRKYGKSAFEMLELAHTDDREYGHFLERLYIAFYQTQGRTGYNSSAGGEAPAFGHKRTKQMREHQSRIMSGKNHPLFGTKVSAATKKKMSDTRTGQLQRPEITTEHILSLYTSGLGTRAIAKVVGMTRSSVQERLKSQNISKHPTGTPRSSKSKVGEVFGYWTIIEDSPWEESGRRQYKCRCICGRIKEVFLTCLRSGASKSCGCMTEEMKKMTRERKNK